MKKIEIDFTDLVFENEELGKLVDEQMEKMNMDEIMSCIMHIIKKSNEEEPGAFENAIPLYKIIHIATEMYKYGFASALYLWNESMKEFFEREGATNADA